jgi:hypothetical protein
MLGEKSVEGEAHLEDDGGAFVIRFRASDSAVTMSGLVDCDRRDAFTVRNLAQSVAGFFDARFTRAEIRKSEICKDLLRSRCAAKRRE